MTHHELRRRIGLAWNALRHGQPVRVTITAHLGFDPNAFDPADRPPPFPPAVVNLVNSLPPEYDDRPDTEEHQ